MDPAANRASHPLAPASQMASYSEWLKIEVTLRYALTYPWAPSHGRRCASISRGCWQSGTG